MRREDESDVKKTGPGCNAPASAALFEGGHSHGEIAMTTTQQIVPVELGSVVALTGSVSGCLICDACSDYAKAGGGVGGYDYPTY